jgi:hypothetical protein
VEVFAITRDRTAYVARTAPSGVVGGAILAALAVLVGIGVIVGVQGVSGPAGKATPTSAPAAQPVTIGPLAIEAYASGAFQPPVIFGVQDTGWSASRDTPIMLGLVRQDSPRGSVQLLRVQEVITTPCGEGQGARTPVGAADLLTALQGLTYLTVSDPQTVRVGGYAGREVLVDVKDEALAACGGLAGVGGVTLFVVGSDIWSAASGERFRLTVVDVHGSAVTIATSADWSQTPSVQELVSMLEYGARIVASIRF